MKVWEKIYMVVTLLFLVVLNICNVLVFRSVYRESVNTVEQKAMVEWKNIAVPLSEDLGELGGGQDGVWELFQAYVSSYSTDGYAFELWQDGNLQYKSGIGSQMTYSYLEGKLESSFIREVERQNEILVTGEQKGKTTIVVKRDIESFFANFKVLVKQGYLELATASFAKEQDEKEQEVIDINLINMADKLKKGMEIVFDSVEIKEGETSPPKRYNSGSMILAMENAGQLIEDEDLRAQIKGSGIGTSATRAEILSKLVNIRYLKLNKKTQVITPELIGEMVYDVVNTSMRQLLNPELTASWELGLALVTEGKVTEEEYMKKLDDFIIKRVESVKNTNNTYALKQYFDAAAAYYK